MHPTQQRASGATATSSRGPIDGPLAISVVLPIYAEKRSVSELVDGLLQLVRPDLHEIILMVAPAAPEETFAICREVEAACDIARLSVQEKTPGLGYAVRQGIDEAQGATILLMDSDGEMDVNTVPLMVAEMKRSGADMVVGSRWVKGGGVEGYDRFKYYLNRGYQLLFRVLYRTRVRDLTLGFKLARAEVMKRQQWDSQFHDIGCETTMRIVRAGHHVTEVPTVWRKRKEGESSNPFRRNFKYVWKALNILIRPKPPIDQ